MNRICPECSTENEAQYTYCKNCGTILPPVVNDVSNDELSDGPRSNPTAEAQTVTAGTEEQEMPPRGPESAGQSPPAPEAPQPVPDPPAPQPAPAQQYYQQYNSWSYGAQTPDSIEGIERNKFITFIGKNGTKIYEKFAKMEFSHSKVSWCWPAAVLTFLFGFLGGAIWFFYRKMYKAALILLAAGILFTGARTALTFDNSVNAIRTTYNVFTEMFESIENMDPNADSDILAGELENEFTDDFLDIGESATSAVIIGNIITLLQNLAGTAVVGIFAFAVYKKHAVDKIRSYSDTSGNEKYYDYGLSLAGGTSGGMLALGVVVLIAVDTISGMLPLIVAIGG